MKQFGIYIILPAMISLIVTVAGGYAYEMYQNPLLFEDFLYEYPFLTRYDFWSKVFIAFVMVGILATLGAINSKMKTNKKSN